MLTNVSRMACIGTFWLYEMRRCVKVPRTLVHVHFPLVVAARIPIATWDQWSYTIRALRMAIIHHIHILLCLCVCVFCLSLYIIGAGHSNRKVSDPFKIKFYKEIFRKYSVFYLLCMPLHVYGWHVALANHRDHSSKYQFLALYSVRCMYDRIWPGDI